ncbi:MAG TPA: cell envelope integrity protein CreD [Solimonas sp.]|nr:cell envelope integrity protein CreD [Solimonas sp.]
MQDPAITDPAPPHPPPRRSLFNTPGGRLLLLGVLLLVLLIPAQMIRGVVQERETRRNEAVANILGSWGGAQQLQGPLLRVPFVLRHVGTNAEGKTVETVSADAAWFLPDTLEMDAVMDTELRRRGIFEVPVYVATVKLRGRFRRPDFSRWGVQSEDIDWQGAELIMGLTEPRALHADAGLSWQGRRLDFRPSAGAGGQWNRPGIHVPLGRQLAEPFAGDGASFDIQFSFNGAERLLFAPTAEKTQLALQADWPHPSFQGQWLPVQRQLQARGFDARWSVSYLGRDYPQQWRESAGAFEALGKASFGTSLATPVDRYLMAERISKYAVLTLVFTFAVIWLTELLSGRRVHPIQYGFVGAGLCLFGLLQLSVAEHFGFSIAFAAAALAVTLMVTLYSRSLLGSTPRALVVGAVLGGLYGYLYTILRAEDYALLGGAVALFLGLAAAMYLTRNFNWDGQPRFGDD